MKRFISYLYTYERGIKGKNIGFIKTDVRNHNYKMEIHVRGLGRFEGKGHIFLLEEEKIKGIEIGCIGLHMGMGNCCLSWETDASIQNEHLETPVGIAIKFGGQYYAVSFWKDLSKEEYLLGTFEIGGEKTVKEAVQMNLGEPEEEIKDKKASVEKLNKESIIMKYDDKLDNRTNRGQKLTGKASGSSVIPLPEEAGASEQARQAEKREAVQEIEIPDEREVVKETGEPKISKAPTASQEFDHISKTECSRQKKQEETESENKIYDTPAVVKKIDIHAIRSLPKRNWYLCNNSFLIHGFMNYHHLILKSVKDNGVQKMYLGVPGVYEKPERVMAMLFGFSEFEDEKHLLCNQIGNPEDEMQEGMFGYWFCLLDT